LVCATKKNNFYFVGLKMAIRGKTEEEMEREAYGHIVPLFKNAILCVNKVNLFFRRNVNFFKD
jgi:hypothetical protein